MEAEGNRGEELLNVSVEIGDGQSSVLRVFEHDDLQLVVRNFFIKNNVMEVDEDAFLRRVNEFMEELIQEHKLVSQALAALPNFSSPVCKNFGERLYRKCMQDKEMRIVRSQMERIQKARKIQESVQDRPKIDRKSVSIVNNSLCKSVSTIKQQSCDNDFSEAQLSPELKSIEASVEKLGRLEEGIQRRRTMELKPILMRESESPKKETIKKRHSQGFDAGVSDKLQSQALLKITQHVKIGIDHNTGIKVFQPVHNTQMRDFGRVVVHNTRSDKLQHSHSPTKLSSVNTEETDQVHKQKIYLSTFSALKNKGKIDPSTADLSKVSPNLAKTLSVLFQQMKKDGIQADFAEFSLRMDDLLSSLSVSDRNSVLSDQKGPKKSMHKQSLSMGSLKTLSSVHNTSRKYSDRDSEHSKPQSKLITPISKSKFRV